MSEASKFSAPFIHMAARIDRNDEADFAGAILIVPPEGQPVEILMVDPSKDPAAFWAAARARVTVAAEIAIQDVTAQQPGFGGRRR